jgi:hypothetical protein
MEINETIESKNGREKSSKVVDKVMGKVSSGIKTSKQDKKIFESIISSSVYLRIYRYRESE